MAPLPPKLRQQPPSAFGAVGRAALASGAGSGHEAQHRAYLQLLQERNQAQRQLRQEDDHRQSHQMRREQGFNVCFSGANSSRRTPSSSSYGGRLRDGCSGAAALGFGRGSGGGGSGDAWGGGAWRKWEERTVEIKGDGGEIYAVRPTGERRDVPASLAAPVKNSRRQSQQDPTLKLNTTLGTTQKELQGLCQELLRASCDEDGPHPGPQAEYSVSVAAEGEAFASACEMPSAGDFAERIARLPRSWRGRILELLEEAEADVALEEAAAEAETSRRPAKTDECLEAECIGLCDDEVAAGITTAPPSPAVKAPSDNLASDVQVAAADRELRTTGVLAAAEAITAEDRGAYSVGEAGAGFEAKVAGTQVASAPDAGGGGSHQGRGVSSPRSPVSAGPAA